jgi:hypothetical protein
MFWTALFSEFYLQYRIVLTIALAMISIFPRLIDIEKKGAILICMTAVSSSGLKRQPLTSEGRVILTHPTFRRIQLRRAYPLPRDMVSMRRKQARRNLLIARDNVGLIVEKGTASRIRPGVWLHKAPPRTSIMCFNISSRSHPLLLP